MRKYQVRFRGGITEKEHCYLVGILPDTNDGRKCALDQRFERLIEGMKQAQGITEQLKAENALEWTGCLSNIRACAREIVEKEIIFA